MGRIAFSIKKRIELLSSQKIIEFSDFKSALSKSREDVKTIKSLEEFGGGLHPFHAVYSSVQNLVSVLMENLSAFKELSAFSENVEKALDAYMPGYPPMSPVTHSQFSYWAIFDLRFGVDMETIGTCIKEMSDVLEIGTDTAELIGNLQETRLGVYSHRGINEDGTISLFEIYANKEYRCCSANNYLGNEGEIWLVRLAPPPFSLGDLHVMVTTPYILKPESENDWKQFFDRSVPRFGINPPILAYNELMKYGIFAEYWNEYIFQAYSGHTDSVIFLQGIPDKSETMPCFDPQSCVDLSKSKTQHEKKSALRKVKKKLKRRRQKGCGKDELGGKTA